MIPRARHIALLCVAVLWPAEAKAQPATDIYLGRLALRNGGFEVGSFRNITDRDGYDNQPHFTPDGTALLYTSIREDGQADTYRYDLASGAVTRLTRTPESEYSPTVMPGGDAFSVVRVEADSTQRLWSFDMGGNVRRLVLEDVKPVGYHAWGDENTVALFVLGDPPTLQLADTRTGRVQVVKSDIGRSLHRVPGSRAISFLQRRSEEEAWIEELELATGQATTLVRTLPGSEDYAWTPDGAILMGQGPRLFAWRRGEDGWTEVGNLESYGIGEISRIAVSPAGDWIAIVSSRP